MSSLVKPYQQIASRICGPVVPINICFNADDSINYAAVRRYVNFLCEQKTPVLMLTYGSSEFGSMTDEEIWRLTAEVAEANAGRALFIAATAWWTPAQCASFLKHAEAVGADAVKVQIHPWHTARRDIIVGYFDHIQAASSIPLLLWVAQPDFSVELVAELARRPQIVGMKNDGDQFYYYYDVIRATAGQHFAVISGGQMRNIVLGYQLGSPAYLCTVAPFRPDIALAFWETLSARRYDDAWQMVFRYEETWLKLAIELDWLPAIKSALYLHGLYPNNRLRSPRLSHGEEQIARVRRCMEEVFGLGK
jgi:4-hydroxy-tetrahydrodipicolinate synthase